MKGNVGTWMGGALLAGCLACGLPARAGEDLAVVRERLRAAGVSEEPAERMLACFTEGVGAEVPLSSLHTRLQEGLVKRADPDHLVEALQRRLRSLVQAQELLEPAMRSRRPGEPVTEACLEILASALESGVPVEAFDGLFAPDGGALSHRLAAIIEAGEMLHLAGVDAADVGLFMRDAAGRNTRRMETFRAVRFWIERHREGMASGEIREGLWRSPPGEPVGGNGLRRRRGRGHGGSSTD